MASGDPTRVVLTVADEQRAAISSLTEQLGDLICDEDLTDKKLRAAAETLLPNLYDALKAHGFGWEPSEAPDS